MERAGKWTPFFLDSGLNAIRASLRQFYPNRTYTRILVKFCPFVVQYM